MDAEQTIADFERLEPIFAAPDTRPLSRQRGRDLGRLPFHTESVISRAYPFRLRFLSGAGRSVVVSSALGRPSRCSGGSIFLPLLDFDRSGYMVLCRAR